MAHEDLRRASKRGRFANTLEWAYWPQMEVLRYLKNRSKSLSIHSLMKQSRSIRTVEFCIAWDRQNRVRFPSGRMPASPLPPFLFCQLHRLLSFLLSVKVRLAGENLCRESISSNASRLTGSGRCFPSPVMPKATTTGTPSPTAAIMSNGTSEERDGVRAPALLPPPGP